MHVDPGLRGLRRVRRGRADAPAAAPRPSAARPPARNFAPVEPNTVACGRNSQHAQLAKSLRFVGPPNPDPVIAILPKAPLAGAFCRAPSLAHSGFGSRRVAPFQPFSRGISFNATSRSIERISSGLKP